VPAMKLTPDAAMRARDVSRPRAEHLTEAEETEASIAGGSRSGSGDAAKPSVGREGATPAGQDREGQPRIPRRRRTGRGRSAR